MNVLRCAGAEAIGTALLLAIIVGSGIMEERLAGGSVYLALLANSLATGFGRMSGRSCWRNLLERCWR